MSQIRTNLAALSAASMSMHPAFCADWFATIPTGQPPILANRVIIFMAYFGLISTALPSSIRHSITLCMS